MNFKLDLANRQKSLVDKKYNLNIDAEKLMALIEVPKDDSMGDLALPCFTLSKELKKAPPAIAKDLESEWSQFVGESPYSQVKATGPYLNFKFKSEYLGSELIPKILSEDYVAPENSNSETMMIEYSQPNTHKSFHVGHIRNVALGDSLSRISQWAGYNVIPVNYIGDVGTHIAKCLWYFKNHFKGEAPKQNRGEFLGDMYVKATDMLDFSQLAEAPFPDLLSAKVTAKEAHPKNKKLSLVKLDTGSSSVQVICGGTDYEVGDLVVYAPIGSKVLGREIVEKEKEGILSQGMICSELELGVSKDRNKIYKLKPNLELGQPVCELTKKENVQLSEPTVAAEMEKRRLGVEQVLKDLESGDTEIHSLWEETKKWSMDNFKENYSWLDVHFDHFFYESDVADPGKEIVKEYLDKGVFERSEGAVGINLSQWKLPFFLLLKSNGTGLYSTKDLALAKLKFEKYKVDRSVYVVDDGQSLHFQQVFKTLEAMGFENAKKCYHLAYGKVERPDGKMSSRKGNVILFSELKDMLLEKITSEYLEKYRGEWSDSEIAATAHKVSIATIKYGMLNQDSKKTIVFDLTEWTARTGNTGPYLMYAYARTQSILRDPLCDSVKDLEANFALLKDPAEHKLLSKMSLFRDTVSKASERFEPQLLCIYLYQLAKDFSSFYSQCPVLKAESKELVKARLGVVQATGHILNKGLDLLGVQTADKM